MSTTSPPTSVAVLDGAVTYTHAALEAARTQPLSLPTPCAQWDLARLLLHMEDSLAAIGEAASLGFVEVEDHPQLAAGDRVVDRIVQRACATREAWVSRLTSAPVAVGDLLLGRDTLVMVGALEITVHGWDLARTTGLAHPVPDELASVLLEVAQAVVTPDERGRRFGPAYLVPPSSPAAIRLLAHLGRR